MRDTFVLHTAYAEKFKRLTDEQFGSLIRSLMEYQATGEEPIVSDNMVAFALELAIFEIKEEQAINRSGKPYVDWRKTVLKRDNFTCRICGSHDNLETHHICEFAYYPELRLDVDNGITLCRDCHKHVHKGNIKIIGG